MGSYPISHGYGADQIKPFCQAQFQSSQVQSNLNWDLHYNHCKATQHIGSATVPPTPDKYIGATKEAEIWHASFIWPY